MGFKHLLSKQTRLNSGVTAIDADTGPVPDLPALYQHGRRGHDEDR